MMFLCIQYYWLVYNEPISLESVTQAVSNVALQFGNDDDDKEMVRATCKLDVWVCNIIWLLLVVLL